MGGGDAARGKGQHLEFLSFYAVFLAKLFLPHVQVAVFVWHGFRVKVVHVELLEHFHVGVYQRVHAEVILDPYMEISLIT